MKLIRPADTLEVVALDLDSARPSEFMRDLLRATGGPGAADGIVDATRWLMGLHLGSKSDYLEGKDVAHNVGKSSFTMPATVGLALCTVIPEDSKTGATITEASYTGYARKKVEAANLTAAEGTSPTKITNSAELVFASCTAGSSTIVGWALCDSTTTGAGNMLYWGTCTSTVISTTQTPATVAVGGLEVTED